MTTYQWDNTDSKISKVSVTMPKKSKGMGTAVIYLSENPDISAETLALPDKLRAQGFAVIADSNNNGRPVLRISNLKSPDELINTLQDISVVTGEVTTKDSSASLTLGEKIKRSSGKIAGYGYIGGDLSMAAGGIARETEGFRNPPKNWEKWKEILKGQFSTGWLWLVGGLGLGRYANEPAGRKQQRLLRTISEFFWQESIDVPENSVLHMRETRKPRGWSKKAEDLMYRFPTEFLNLFYAIGSGFLMRAGLQRNENNGARNWGKFSAGAFVLLGALNGIFVKPQKMENLESKGFFGKLWHKTRENPLITSSVAYFANNIAGFWGAAVEKRQLDKLLEKIEPEVLNNPNAKTTFWFGDEDKRPTYAQQKRNILNSRAFPMFDFGVYSFYGIGNTALMMTDKSGGHGGGAADAIDAVSTIYAAAAETLLSLPLERREEIIPKLAEHLRKARGISSFAEDIEAGLRRKIAELSSHPLLRRQEGRATTETTMETTGKSPAPSYRKQVEDSRSPAAEISGIPALSFA